MTRTKSMYYKPSAEADELFVCAVNDGDLYRSRISPMIDNLAKKYRNGQYYKERAIDGWYNIACAAVKMYEREYMSPGDGVRVFDVTARFTCAVDMEARYFENVEYRATENS